jgi:pimeloyl-ACP methyl ester carboxylesterase
MQPPKRIDVGLADGRKLEALVAGPQDGTLLVFHHGSPGAAVPFPALEQAAAERGIRVATFSRPGFSASTRLPGRTVADCAADVAALADHLEAERFLTAGWSGGGPHALACATLLAERVLATATIAGVAPYDAKGLDWTDGMGKDNQIEYPLAASDPEELLRWLQPQVEVMAAISPEGVVGALRSLISDVDEVSLSGELGEVLAASFRAAFLHGPWGWYDDDLAFVAPWGFELSAIRVPVTIWQGEHDLMVPLAHGRWLAAHVPSASAELRPEHGHLSLVVGNLGEIVDDLMEQGRVRVRGGSGEEMGRGLR